MHQGNCLCGAVSYEVAGPLGRMIHCHCSMCRKHHGSAFATFVDAPLAGYRVTRGRDQVVEYNSSSIARRSFCRICGSVTPAVSIEMDRVFIPVGNLQGDVAARPEAHFFVGSRAPWHSITDSLPQYDEYPPEFELGGQDQPEREAIEGSVTGSCLCGDVAFKFSGTPLRITNCHCTRCRRGRSAAHASNFIYPLDEFAFTRGEDSLSNYKVPEARFFGVAFCRRCGSAAPRVARERSLVVIPGGALDSDPALSPTSHIFVGSKANWFDITDQLPQNQAML